MISPRIRSELILLQQESEAWYQEARAAAVMHDDYKKCLPERAAYRQRRAAECSAHMRSLLLGND